MTGVEEYILKKKRKIVLFDEGTEGTEMLYIDDDGYLQMPKKQDDEIIGLGGSTEKRDLGWIKEDTSKYK